MSAFYYLRVVFALYSRSDAVSDQPAPGGAITPAVSLAASTAAVVFFGVYPTPLVRLAEAAARALGF
jgi:NADH:ubiquinone oxidoreductase subunit 2 (subunit N)